MFFMYLEDNSLNFVDDLEDVEYIGEVIVKLVYVLFILDECS